jgi:signal transduction histidine kinase
MTPGTSPRPGGSPFTAWAAGIAALGRVRTGGGSLWLARGAASAHLAALGMLLTTAWRVAGAGDGAALGLARWHLAFLLVTGAAAALLTVACAGRDSAASRGAVGAMQNARLAELLAQMGHELRTPLNAVIGFSEVMQRELHGPLGHARYHEYALHIGESGGRLLQASEQALAMTEALTGLIADGRARARDKVCALALVSEAWHRLSAPAAPAKVALTTSPGASSLLTCERSSALQALECLLRQARTLAGEGSRICVSMDRRAGRARLTIGTEPRGTRRPASVAATGSEGGLLLGLAQLLLETQGVALTCQTAEDGSWSAVLTFPTGC